MFQLLMMGYSMIFYFLAGFMIWFWNLMMRYDMDCLDALWEWLREWYDRNIVHSMMYQNVLGIWQWESIDSLTMFDYWTWCDMDTKGLTWFKHQKMGIHITLKMGYGWNWDGGSLSIKVVFFATNTRGGSRNRHEKNILRSDYWLCNVA